ncbi:beta-hexosaminidase [Achromatium sp. WMS2]|nr:beta-hexosaminidase [Achromatium sp. WMS2]
MPLGPLILDLEGLTLTPEDKDLLKHPAVGGVILFARNFNCLSQLIELTTSIRNLRPELLICVDQEGGRVQRFRNEFVNLPPAAWYGDQYQVYPDKAQYWCYLAGWLMAAELIAAGIDFSFAPVLDLGYGPSQVIGNRAFAQAPQIVSQLAQAWISGVHSAGMPAVGKHFPGHGAVRADSHVELPIDERPLATITASDIVPFKQAIAEGLDAIMPAHVVYSQIDSQPAGFSKYWLQTVLRTELKFTGVIFSDDLSMEATQLAGGYGARALAALNAGCDMVLVCNNRQGAIDTAQTLVAYDNKPVQQRLSKMRARINWTWDQVHNDTRWQEISAVLPRA